MRTCPVAQSLLPLPSVIPSYTMFVFLYDEPCMKAPKSLAANQGILKGCFNKIITAMKITPEPFFSKDFPQRP